MAANPNPVTTTVNDIAFDQYVPSRYINIPQFYSACQLHHDAMVDATQHLNYEQMRNLAVGIADEFLSFKLTCAQYLEDNGHLSGPEWAPLRWFLAQNRALQYYPHKEQHKWNVNK